MSTNNPNSKSWVYMNDYPNDIDHIKVDIDNILSKLLVFEQDTNNNCCEIQEELKSVHKKLDEIEKKITQSGKIEEACLRLETKCKQNEGKLNQMNLSIEDKLEQLELKLDKITQSYKSLLKYFNEMHTMDMRELNYNIRSFYTKGNPPVNFVPDRTNKLS